MYQVNYCIHNKKLFTDGRISGGINQEGITFYNNFINELIANGHNPSQKNFQLNLKILKFAFYNFLSIVHCNHN